RDSYLHTILERQAPLLVCSTPGCPDRALWRCKDCIPQPVYCATCCRRAHMPMPFHRVEKWTGTHYQDDWLLSVGVFIPLGHRGRPCPSTAHRFPGYDTPTNPSPSPGQPSPETRTNVKPTELDMWGNPMIHVVDSSGVHLIGINWCECKEEDHHMQLFRHGLFPATFKSPKTAFTFQVLDEQRLDNLECKTTAFHFFGKLRRLTNPAFPHSVPNRYRELLRVSRQWRDLKYRRWHGWGHQNTMPGEGDMALFCFICPRNTFNMEDNWRDDPDQLSNMVVLAMDGNYENSCLKMRRPENDVVLSEGSGFMTARPRYRKHLDVAVEFREKSTCHDHKAVKQVNAKRDHLSSTGLGAIVCMHGCFVPNTVVDFQGAEMQMNMDYSLSMAARFFSFLYLMLLLYDIMCQYSKRLVKRFDESPYLEMPAGMTVKKGIGLFHVHGHKDECLAQYSPNYIIGARQVDGETCEPLWWPLNEVARSTKSMAYSHRREILDDHMSDSNWKKTVAVPKVLCKKYKKAVVAVKETSEYLVKLTDSADPNSVREWIRADKHAQENRDKDPSLMDIYDIKLNKRECSPMDH
ncbi:hypothetical protein DENSPDRAFT_780026, partial [Dentipellis sp. KUC8613]